MTINRLSVRREDGAGRGLAEHECSFEAREADRIVIMIHGFNTSKDDASAKYRALAREIEKRASGGFSALGELVEFHWPGDHPNAAVSLASYGSRVGPAKDAGQKLARRWLRCRRRDQHVVVIAHSLGCRAALELEATIADIAEESGYNGARIDALFLMAAAVPVSLCTPASDYPAPIEGAAEHVLVSKKDGTLLRWFNAGQDIANEPGEAVGIRGDPAHRWTTVVPTTLDHGEYWGDAYLAHVICRILGVRSWKEVVSRTAAPDRALAEGPRQLGQRRRSRRLIRRRSVG